MAAIHREPYVTLAGITSNSALISWGAFFFETRGDVLDGRFKLIDDDDLRHVNPPRSNSIGETAADFGPAAVFVWEKGTDPSGATHVVVPSTSPATRVNHAWISGLKPNTPYQYRVKVKGEGWAEEERRDWVSDARRQGMFLNGRRYEHEFTTLPSEGAPAPPFAFAVIGDYGKGVKDRDSEQAKIAEALEMAVRTKGVRFVLTTGDHIYGRGLFHSNDTGDEDSDWFFTHYQPYRYILNRVPFYPACGNHDTGETETSDDYVQMLDNFYIRERFFAGDRREGAAVLERGLFYRFSFGNDVEFISIDSSRPDKRGLRAFSLSTNTSFLNSTFPSVSGAPSVWRIPFFHHPPYVDGPTKGNDADAERDLVQRRFEPGGVRLVFNGHEHNFQVSRHNGIHYVLSGAAGEVRDGRLRGDSAAHNIAWSPKHHFLLVEYGSDRRMRITPYGPLVRGALTPVVVQQPNGSVFPLPLQVSL